MSRCLATWIFLACLAAYACPQLPARQIHDAGQETWTANGTLANRQVRTVEGLGAAQGVSFHDGKIYLYGDVWDAQPRVGVIREYDLELKPTGRAIWLTRNGQPLIRHPTGLTWHERWGTFLGDTVDRKAVIYRIDWKIALRDGNLDRAIIDVIEDDAAINGCRPEFVSVAGQALLATADYGNIRPEVRLYVPEKLLHRKRTSAPGVVAHRFLAGPFNQNLYWDSEHRHLVCIQNVVEGRGWQLDVLDLEKAIADGRASAPGVRVKQWTLPARDELEGYRPLDKNRGLFITASQKVNVTIGTLSDAMPQSPAPK